MKIGNLYRDEYCDGIAVIMMALLKRDKNILKAVIIIIGTLFEVSFHFRTENLHERVALSKIKDHKSSHWALGSSSRAIKKFYLFWDMVMRIVRNQLDKHSHMGDLRLRWNSTQTFFQECDIGGVREQK